jgi:hypothetical protein
MTMTSKAKLNIQRLQVRADVCREIDRRLADDEDRRRRTAQKEKGQSNNSRTAAK